MFHVERRPLLLQKMFYVEHFISFSVPNVPHGTFGYFCSTWNIKKDLNYFYILIDFNILM